MLKETLNKIYSNKDAHILLFVLILAGAILSGILDIIIGKPNSSKQNIVDLVIGIFLGVCSIQFLRNVLRDENNGELSFFDKIKAEVYFKMIAVNFIWGIMVVVIAIPLIILLAPIFAGVTIAMSKSLLIACIVAFIFAMLSAFYTYVSITLADTLQIKKAINPMIIFKALTRTARKTYAQFFKCVGLTILFVIAFLAAYIVFGFVGLISILQITPDFSILDVFMHAVAWYALFVIWSLIYPYSLLDTYVEKLRDNND